MSIVRRIRAASILGGMWAISWAIVGVGLVTCVYLFSRPRFVIPLQYLRRSAIDVGLVFGAVGFVAGALFALGLSKAARSGTIDDMSVGRAVLWGGLAGATPVLAMALIAPISSTALLAGIVVGTVVGSASAAVTVSVARRPLSSGVGDREMLPADR